MSNNLNLLWVGLQCLIVIFPDHSVSTKYAVHTEGPNEQFGTHEKLSWGVQGNLNWMPGN